MELRKETERRLKHRFAIEREMRYKVAEEGVCTLSGDGLTVDIGSGGVGFVVERPLKQGAFVELSISWPALLNESCPMRLIVFGRVLRSQPKKTVCSIDKYEFRTQSRTLQPVPAPRADKLLRRWAEGVRRGVLKTNMVHF